MTKRLNLLPVFRGQWRGLSRGKPPDVRPDWLSRCVLYGIPIAVLAASLAWGWTVAAPGAILSGVALLAGGLLSSFTFLSTVRMKVTEWSEAKPARWATERAMLDETAAHVLSAATACIIEAVLIVIGMNVSSAPHDAISGPLAAATLAVAAYVVVNFLVCVPRLYNAYIELNSVSTELSGFTRGRL